MDKVNFLKKVSRAIHRRYHSSIIYQCYHKIKLENRFPSLRNSSQKFCETTNNLKPYYEQYISKTSTADMACSLETGVFLKVFCEVLKPKCILDLGSGFSSFVLRSYAASRNDIIVCSVDDSSEWLEHARAYLMLHNLSTERLILWSQFKQCSSSRFDFIFHDLGDMDLRKISLHLVLKIGEGDGVILLDDMHMISYPEYVHNCLNRYSCRFFDLQSYTRDKFGRYCGLVSDICKNFE